MKKLSRPLSIALLVLLVASSAVVIGRVWSLAPLATTQKKGELALAPDPLHIALTPLDGDSALDREIRDLQGKVERGGRASLERLGWAFVEKARLSSDPGFYNLAEQAARAILTRTPNDPAGLLLLGHIRDSQHRFAEAEGIARRLTEQRDFVFDYALLGDALMELGRLDEAVEAYQKMVDLKPCLQTYSRVAHMRWLKGDLAGATQAIELAVSAGNPREPEPTAWACTRLALYQLQAGQGAQALTSTDLALQAAPNYAPALLVRGRILLGTGRKTEALAPLQQAADICPLPEYLWTQAEALRANGRIPEAEKVEARLATSGESADPRTYALFLATRGQDGARALRLASAELANRHDVHTYDAVAWAELARGDIDAARANMQSALAEKTQDARLFLHAGSIAAAAGKQAEALQFFNQAHGIEQMLLPSEREALGQRTADVLGASPQISAN